MAFIVATSPRYFAPASFNLLDSEGRLLTSNFDIQCKRMTKEELEQLDVDIAKWRRERVESTGQGQQVDADREIVKRVMVGWRGVQEADGSEIEFSWEAVDRVESMFPGFIGSCVRAFMLSTAPTKAAHLAAEKN